MVSSEASKILARYNAYRATSGQSQVKYTASRDYVEPQKDVSMAKINLVQAQSRAEIANINEKMNANQQDIEMIQSDYRNRNPQAGSSKMNQELRVQNPQYGGLLDDQRNLQEQKQTLEDKLVRNETILAGDINKDAQSDFSGIRNTSPMDAQAQVVPVTYGTQNPNDRVEDTALEGTFADPNFGKNQSTINAIYARQNQDRIDNAVQSNYFWQLREGKVPIGKALYEPETKNTYYSGDTKLSEMANKTQRMELTRLYLEDAGQTFDTPIGNVKTSPTKYYDSRSIAKRAEILSMPMGDLQNYTPSLTKEGDYSGYIEPTEYRKRITTSSPSEYNTNTDLIGTGTPNLVRFTASTKFNDNVVTSGGNTLSVMSGLNFLMYGMPVANAEKSTEKEPVLLPTLTQYATDVVPKKETDWLGGEITEIPDDPYQQFAKGLSAEPFNIAQTGKQLITGKEQEYAPSLIGDTLEAFQSGEIEYKDYSDDFGENVNTFFENASRTVTGLQDPVVQEKIGKAFGEFGERVQKYPIYYIGSGITEVGLMVLPIGKVSTTARAATKGIGATKSAVVTKSLDPLKEAVKSTDKQAVEIAQQFAGDKSVKLVKQEGKRFIVIDKIVKDMDFMPKMTTKTKTIVKTKMRFKRKDGKGNLKQPVEEKNVITDQGATIEKLEDRRYLVNLGEGQSGKGYGYAIIDLKNQRTGVIMKEFNPLKEPPRWVKQATTKDYPPEQLGNINWISNKALKGDSGYSKNLIKELQKGRKEATGGEPFPKQYGIQDDLFDQGLLSQQPVYMFRGGKPFFPVNNPVTRGETVKDFFLTQAQKLGLKKNSKTLMQSDVGENPMIVAKTYNIAGTQVKKSPLTRYMEMVETAGKRRDDMNFREALRAQGNKDFWARYRADWGKGQTSRSGKGGYTGGKKGGGKKGDGGDDRTNKGNDGSSTKQIYKDFSDPSIPIDRQAVDAMTKATTTPPPVPKTGSDIPFGSTFAPLAYGSQGQSTQPAPRIGTTNLFRPQPTVQESKPLQKTQTIQQTEQFFNTRINTNVIPKVKTDIMSMTDSAVKQIGAVSTQLDNSVRQDMLPKVAQVQGFVLKQTQTTMPKVTEMFAPKPITENKKVTPPRPIPSMWRAPPIPVLPFDLQTGGQRKKKKSKKKKLKGEATAWAVPDVWFDAKGYYFSKGNAYVKGAKAKNPPKPKGRKKTKR